MTNCEKHKGKIKLGGYKGGRGYCGYHTTYFGKKVYLRSIQEFIYAKYLDSLRQCYLTENIIYEIDGKKYKPDFFIYENEFKKLLKIVEIKYTNKEQSYYQKRFSEYFRNHNIEYTVLDKTDVKQFLKLGIISKVELEKWKNDFVKKYDRFDYSGEKNPMYGVKHSIKTKIKIGKLTKEHFKNKEIRNRHKEGRNRFWKSDQGITLKKEYAKLRHQESIIKNPIIQCICNFCGKSYYKKLKDRYNKETCSNSCQQKYNWKLGRNVYKGNSIKTYKTKLRNYFRRIHEVMDKRNIDTSNYNNIINYQKSIGNIPKHFGMNLYIVEKYFGTLTNLKKEVD